MRHLPFFFLLPAALFAQMPNPGPHVEAMKKFAFLLGEWQGEGWVEAGPDGRQTFDQTEKVRLALQGTIIVIEGQGRHKSSGEIGHDAQAVISFDPATGKYSMTSWSYPGRQGSFEIQPREQGFTWNMKIGPMSMRYTMALTGEGHWHETGEMTRDGETWNKFVEFTVKKVK